VVTPSSRGVVLGAGGRLAAAIDANHITIWSVAERRVLAIIPAHDASGLVLSSDESLVAAWVGGAIVVWRTADGHELQRWRGVDADSLLLGPHNDRVVAWYFDSNTPATLLDLRNGKRMTLRSPFGANEAAFSPDGQLLALASSDGRGRLRRECRSLQRGAPTAAQAVWRRTQTTTNRARDQRIGGEPERQQHRAERRTLPPAAALRSGAVASSAGSSVRTWLPPNSTPG
jgi:WD40 repeat protein